MTVILPDTSIPAIQVELAVRRRCAIGSTGMYLLANVHQSAFTKIFVDKGERVAPQSYIYMCGR